MYFVHSYYIIPEDESVIATTAEYGIEFASSIWRDNIFACQFHPEKSQNIGLNILRRFKEVATDAALAASIFHFRKYTIHQVKHYLREKGMPVRL